MNKRITIQEAVNKGYRENCNGEWLRKRNPNNPDDDKEYFIGEDVMTPMEAELLADLIGWLPLIEGYFEGRSDEYDAAVDKTRSLVKKARGEL